MYIGRAGKQVDTQSLKQPLSKALQLPKAFCMPASSKNKLSSLKMDFKLFHSPQTPQESITCRLQCRNIN